MADLIAELEPVLRLLAQRPNVKLNLEIQSGLPPLSIDRLRIQHVVCALVQNAIEASRAMNPPLVRIAVSGDPYLVLVDVVDHGADIPAAARDQLFRPSFTTKADSTGLGLASSRAIMEAHQGTIGFEDMNGGGAKFWFRLPADAGENAT